MLKNDIENLKRTLNTMIDMEEDYCRIYEISVQLDSLIVQYYRTNMKKK